MITVNYYHTIKKITCKNCKIEFDDIELIHKSKEISENSFLGLKYLKNN